MTIARKIFGKTYSNNDNTHITSNLMLRTSSIFIKLSEHTRSRAHTHTFTYNIAHEKKPIYTQKKHTKIVITCNFLARRADVDDNTTRRCRMRLPVRCLHTMSPNFGAVAVRRGVPKMCAVCFCAHSLHFGWVQLRLGSMGSTYICSKY